MKKTIPFTLCALLFAVAGSSFGATHVQCPHAKDNCVPPVPPAPPLPPAPPAPPAPPPPLAGLGETSMGVPAIPAPPGMPAIPVPPPPPAIPDVPQAAHAACASKVPGSALTYSIKKGETMTGVCERVNGKMVFQLRRYHLED